MQAQSTPHALVWHDLRTDADVYVYPSEDEAKRGAIQHLIEYLRSYRHWDDRVRMAEYLERALEVSSPDLVYDWTVKEMDNNLDGELEKLYYHVTPVLDGHS